MVQTMSSEQKKALLLLKFFIFSFHGLDDREKKLMKDSAEKLDALDELNWVNDFINEDPSTSFDRARLFFTQTIATYDPSLKLTYLNSVWDATNQKGFISEAEAVTILKLAKEWGVQKELLSLVRNKA